MKKMGLEKPKKPKGADGREVRGAETRARLRAATEELIAEIGIEAATTVAIAQRCGVSRGALLHHYPTRTDLIIDTANHFWHRAEITMSEMAGSVQSGQIDIREFITNLYAAVFRSNALVTMMELMVGGRSDERIKKSVDAILTDLFIAYEVVGEHVFSGSGLPKERVHVLTTMIVSTLRGLRIQDGIDPDEERVSDVLEMLTKAVELLVRAAPSSATPANPSGEMS